MSRLCTRAAQRSAAFIVSGPAEPKGCPPQVAPAERSMFTSTTTSSSNWLSCSDQLATPLQ